MFKIKMQKLRIFTFLFKLKEEIEMKEKKTHWFDYLNCLLFMLPGPIK